MSKSWSKAKVLNAVQNSKNLTQVIENLGLKVSGGYYFRAIIQHIDDYSIDTSHFTEQISFRPPAKKRPLEEILVENSDYLSTSNLKKRLLREGVFEYYCYNEKCGIAEWLGKPISLQLDHKDGNPRNNRIENLWLLCPNCHAQTETHSKRNYPDKIAKINLCECGKEISIKSQKCVNCENINKKENANTSIEWPNYDDLLSLTNRLGFRKTGRMLGVSDNAIRKRLKKASVTA